MTEIRPGLTLLQCPGDAALSRAHLRQHGWTGEYNLAHVESAPDRQHSSGDWRYRT
jgi:hypothetical protein